MTPDMEITIHQPRLRLPHDVGVEGYDVHMRTLPWDSNVHDVIEAVYGLLVSMGFLPSSIVEGMDDFARQRGVE